MVMTMKNKVLIELIVPEIDEKYDLYIPINKKVGNIIVLLNKVLKDMTNGVYIASNANSIYNSITGEKYHMDVLVRETNIRNGSILVIL